MQLAVGLKRKPYACTLDLLYPLTCALASGFAAFKVNDINLRPDVVVIEKSNRFRMDTHEVSHFHL